MATDPVGARNMPLQTSKPHPGLSDLTRSTDNTDGTTGSTSTDNSTCGTRLMMMLARRGEGREIEEGRDGKGKGEREPETKRKGASAMIGRSIKPLPIFMDILFSIAIYMSSLKLLFVLSEWSLQSLQSGLCNGAPPHTGSQLECGEVNEC